MLRTAAVRLVLAAAVAASVVRSAESAPPLAAGSPSRSERALGAGRLPDASPDLRRTAGAVRVIDRAAIERSGARHLAELLGREAGLNAFDQNGSPFSATVDLRGFNATPAPAAAVVVDGVRVNEADFGQVNWQLIPLAELERVEVHPGPGTLYGRGALSGVIHVTTRRAAKGEPFAVHTGALYGSFHRRKGWSGASGAIGAFDWRLHLEREREGGWRNHAAGDVGTARLKAGWRPDGETDLAVSYQRSDDRIAQGGSITGAELAADRRQNVSEVDTISRLDALTVEARRALPWELSLSGNAYWRARREDTPLNRGRTSRSRSLADLASRGGTLQLAKSGEAYEREWTVLVGGEGGRGEADSSSSGSFGAFPFASGSLVKDDAAAVFAQATVDVLPDLLTATAGLRYDESRAHYEDKVTPTNNGRTSWRRSSPRFGLAWSPSERAAAYVSYAEAFRAPNALELTAIGPFGAQPLNPVQARQYELGARGSPAESVALSAALYRGETIDEIYFDPTQGAFGKNVNVPKVRRYGTELSASWEGERWEARAGHAWTRARFASALTLSKAPFARQRVEAGADLPMVPEHKGSLEVAFKPASGWRVSADGVCVGSQRIVGDEANLEPTLPAYCVANLGARLERGDWTLALRGTNVTDSRHQSRSILATLGGRAERFYVPAPGAGVSASVAWRWGPGGGEAGASSAGAK